MAGTYNVVLLVISLAIYGWHSQLEKRRRTEELSWRSGSVALLQLQVAGANMLAYRFFVFAVHDRPSLFILPGRFHEAIGE